MTFLLFWTDFEINESPTAERVQIFSFLTCSLKYVAHARQSLNVNRSEKHGTPQARRQIKTKPVQTRDHTLGDDFSVVMRSPGNLWDKVTSEQHKHGVGLWTTRRSPVSCVVQNIYYLSQIRPKNHPARVYHELKLSVFFSLLTCFEASEVRVEKSDVTGKKKI